MKLKLIAAMAVVSFAAHAQSTPEAPKAVLPPAAPNATAPVAAAPVPVPLPSAQAVTQAVAGSVVDALGKAVAPAVAVGEAVTSDIKPQPVADAVTKVVVGIAKQHNHVGDCQVEKVSVKGTKLKIHFITASHRQEVIANDFGGSPEDNQISVYKAGDTTTVKLVHLAFSHVLGQEASLVATYIPKTTFVYKTVSGDEVLVDMGFMCGKDSYDKVKNAVLNGAKIVDGAAVGAVNGAQATADMMNHNHQ